MVAKGDGDAPAVEGLDLASAVSSDSKLPAENPAAPAAAAVGQGGREAPNTPEVSSKHWRKIRSAVVALAAFRSRRVKATDFERIRMCGEGGSGLVYLVRLKNTTMFFALKVQRKIDLEAKEKRIRRALIEKEVLVACAHPFVCNLYTAFQDTRHLYLLMDFCAGGDLKSLVTNVVKRALTEAEARFYISEIVVALEWVHLHGYVYRDLKPENVLIHASGHIRLGDFGTAERGSLLGDKISQQAVDRALVEESVLSPVVATVAIPPVEAGGDRHLVAGGGSGQTLSEEEEEEEEEEEDHNKDAGGLDDSVMNAVNAKSSIVVQVDPMLASGSPSLSAPTNVSSAVAATGAGAVAFASSPSSVAVVGFSADSGGRRGGGGGGGGGDNAFHRERGATSTVGCGCCWRRNGHRNTTAASEPPTEEAQAHPFAKGRGSVKLNVLLDSQTFIGTADFMAPEMVTGKEQQSTGMDWWALGVMLFELTLGTLPFNSELPFQGNNEVFRKIVNSELRFPRRHKLSRSAVDVIEQLLRKNPTERLGQRKGVGEIKRHHFFHSVHWALIANSTPPFVLSGPDNPEWLASMQSAPNAPASRDAKMATWTWVATQQDGPRPGVLNTNPFATSGVAPDPLDASRSGRHSETDLSRLGDELGISGGPTDAEAAAATAKAQGGRASKTKTGGSTGVGGADGGNDYDYVPDHGPVLKSSETAPGLAQGARGDSVAGPGGEAGGAAPPKRTKDQRASFDGYDFNNMQKVGSFRLGVGSKNIAGAPELAAARSMDAAGFVPA